MVFGVAEVSLFPALPLGYAAAESHLIAALDASVGFPHLRACHARLVRLGLSDSSFLTSRLLRRLAELAVPMDPYPRLAFSQVPQPNSFLWTALIRGYALLGPFQGALRHYTLMRLAEAPPLSFTFSALLKSCGAERCIDSGAQVHAQTILLGGFDEDLFVQNTLVDMYVKCDRLPLARRVFDGMCTRDIISWTSMIVAYSRSGNMGSAEMLFKRAPVKDMVAWTAMISGYVQNARPRNALAVFRRMQEEGIEADDVTLVGAISACAQLGAVGQARWVCDVLQRMGLEKNVVVGSALVDMFGKCGLIHEARRAFDTVDGKNVYTYSAMIVALAAHGQAKGAIKLFEEMVEQTQVKPNRVTFIGVLTACSHAGMVDEGRLYFNSMKDKYGIIPSPDHYACMVDLLGRAGLLQEAFELVGSVPGETHAGVWGALLGACRIHSNVEIAEVAANALFELEPDCIGNYVLLSNIYAHAGMWEKVSYIRKLMRKKGLRKNPGCCFVEGKDGLIHEFFAGDVSHPRMREIKATLEELLDRLRSAGYVPNLSCVVRDVSDGEKMSLLEGHSEKLALAFGLLTTEATETIRIIKNLRVCDDCHAVMCMASLVRERKIVVRDNLRFHHFQGGECSCGGFW